MHKGEPSAPFFTRTTESDPNSSAFHGGGTVYYRLLFSWKLRHRESSGLLNFIAIPKSTGLQETTNNWNSIFRNKEEGKNVRPCNENGRSVVFWWGVRSYELAYLWKFILANISINPVFLYLRLSSNIRKRKIIEDLGYFFGRCSDEELNLGRNVGKNILLLQLW